MPKIPHTIRLDSGIYKINVRVPKILQAAGAFSGKAKIVESLSTTSYKIAALKAPERVAMIKKEFAILEQQLSESRVLAEEGVDARQSRRSRITEIRDSTVVGMQECYFNGSKRHAEAIAERFARQWFVEMLRDAEATIEKHHTSGDYETLDAILGDSGRILEQHSSMGSELQPVVTGRELLMSALREMGMPFSDEGLDKIELVHDKFRRAVVEVERRSIQRIEEILIAKKNGVDAGVGWKCSFDGFFSDLSAFFDERSGLQPVAMETQRQAAGEGQCLRELCEEYLQKQKNVGVAPKTLRDVEASIIHLQAALSSDLLVSKLGVEEAKKVVDFIASLPKGMKLHGTLEDVRRRVQLAASETGFTPMSARTYEKKCTMVNAIMSFAVSDYPEEMSRNPFSSSGVQAYIKQATPCGEGRDVVHYTVEQLNRLFSLPLYTGHGDGIYGWKRSGNILSKETGRYWVPLLMLFHGCRLNEVAQLMVADVDVAGVIPYFKLSTYHGVYGKERTPKRLKNKSSERLVPIHQELIRCGFLEFVKKRQQEGELWLFPEWTHKTIETWKIGDPIPPNASKHSDLASDHCLKLRDRIQWNEGNPKPCNHSFRHMARTALRVAGVDSKIAETLMGWSDGKKTMGDHYGETPLEMLRDAVNAINYKGLKIEHLYQPRRRRGW